ncbi:hypothetical protein L211DRAFT_851583 [Terfezia boudieri ATCC MYA-4762]|uniref:Uncharacterized protein n=1 Tax=Terfezia boudieri ATCC MYA-4762 TaxID=1051890 RepID=A0A3N4LEA2_9PEZI|nr:hypothetical protein L211DRAFT_851583 [Terfezia boudieri ATCC MYA-4762]
MIDSNLPALAAAEPAELPEPGELAEPEELAEPILQKPHDIYVNQGHELLVRSLYVQEQLHQSLTGEQAEHFVSLQQTHTTKMQQMVCSPTAPTPSVHIEGEDMSDNLHQKPIIQEFVPPALNKFRQKKAKGKAKAHALTGAELAERYAYSKKRCRRGEVSHQETQEVISVIASTAPM